MQLVSAENSMLSSSAPSLSEKYFFGANGNEGTSDQLVVPEPSRGGNLGFQRSGTTQPDSSMKKK